MCFGGGIQARQLKTLCAANVAGDTLLPTHIFPGERFKTNLMSGCVDGAYFGRTPNGWFPLNYFMGG